MTHSPTPSNVPTDVPQWMTAFENELRRCYNLQVAGPWIGNKERVSAILSRHAPALPGQPTVEQSKQEKPAILPLYDTNHTPMSVGDKFLYQVGTKFEDTYTISDKNGVPWLTCESGNTDQSVEDFWYARTDEGQSLKIDSATQPTVQDEPADKCIICGGNEPCSHDFDKINRQLEEIGRTMGSGLPSPTVQGDKQFSSDPHDHGMVPTGEVKDGMAAWARPTEGATPRIYETCLNWDGDGDHVKRLVAVEDFNGLEAELATVTQERDRLAVRMDAAWDVMHGGKGEGVDCPLLTMTRARMAYLNEQTAQLATLRAENEKLRGELADWKNKYGELCRVNSEHADKSIEIIQANTALQAWEKQARELLNELLISGGLLSWQREPIVAFLSTPPASGGTGT